MKYYFGICDDEHISVERIKKYIEQYMQKVKQEYDVRIINTGKELLEHMKNNELDLVFLDMDMPVMSGIDIAAKLYEQDKNQSIVFVTAHEINVFKSLEFFPFGFVRKINMEEELLRVLSQYIKGHEREGEVIQVPRCKIMVPVEIKNIIYLQSSDHNVIICLNDGTEWEVRGTLLKYEQELKERMFVRIHKSYIVNLRYISYIGAKEVVLDNDRILSMSRERKEAVSLSYSQFVKEKRG